jgi:MrcB-like, N-terminal domain
MPSQLDARRLAESLVGQTISTPTYDYENRVLEVRGANVYVGTDASPDGEPVLLAQLQRGLDLLLADGEVRIEPATFNGYRRSSFIGAVLASLPGTVTTPPPTWVRLAPESPFQDQLIEACRLVRAPRTTPNVTADDPLHRLMVHDLRDTIRALVNDETGFKVQGSAGQVNFPWAETPWVAVFDRLVTESAQRGHYVVYLVHPQGAGVYLSLNQAVTEARASSGGRGKTARKPW